MPDVLNTVNLTAQNATGDNLNTAFLSGGEAGLTSDLSITGALSVTGAEDVSSTLSVRGVTTLHAALNSASAISGGALTGTSVTGSSASLSGLVSLRTLSFNTLASSGITVGSSTAEGWFVTIGASGLSLGLKSGGSLYFINSTVSAA